MRRTIPSVSPDPNKPGEIERGTGFGGYAGALSLDVGLLHLQVGQALGRGRTLCHHLRAGSCLLVDQSHSGLRVPARSGGLHHGIKLRNTAVQITHVGLGQRDLLRDRSGITIDGFLRGDLPASFHSRSVFSTSGPNGIVR